MDAKRFDTITRSLTATPTRRRVSLALSGLTLGGMLVSLAGLTDAEAKKKKGKKKKKCKGGTKKCGKKCIAATSCCSAADCGSGGACQNGACASTCVPQCAATNPCGPDGCDGLCGTCTGSQTCQDGRCCLAAGEPCATNAQCCSGQCAAGLACSLV